MQARLWSGCRQGRTWKTRVNTPTVCRISVQHFCNDHIHVCYHLLLIKAVVDQCYENDLSPNGSVFIRGLTKARVSNADRNCLSAV